MSTVKICMIAVLCLAVIIIVKQWKSDFLPLLRIGAIVLFATVALGAVAPFLTYLVTLTKQSGVEEYAEILIKALGIAILTQCCAEICRESGENSIAGGVELTGKVEILLLCLPLMEEILTLANDLLSMGGTAG
ncbi:MAG: hypothetical protein IJW92_08165 [Clostridia bacterium]|nr:hypothetical protein [Clostridia bacterium]